MSLQNQGLPSVPKPKRSKHLKDSSIDFCRIGGLNNHLKMLREIIIFPLLHGNVFSHFNIKAPRGVLFYGPPGTGKTLVAAALATEITKEGIGKVAFFPRKGADVLDKWVGGSEKNLRDLFEKATKCKPAIIFFDELDGLAPVRDKQTDQVHSSVVATLLALMDGLDNKPGLIVIGATNRIDAVDPALRRPGRFDKELYFPLPGVEARRQILEVHTKTWKHRPSSRLLTALVEATSGFSGADLQALCSEAIVRCMKRAYPCLQGVKIDPDKLKVDECDFRNARLCMVPSTQKNGLKMRKLTSIIEPLLEGQLRKVMRSIQTFWPHFLQENYKYITGEERYAGRVLLIGNSMQGVDNHIIPALLQQLEYLPSFIFDVTYVSKKTNMINAQVHHPSVILLSRVDDWWSIIDECDQLSIVSALEDIHAGLPILVVATCRKDVPFMARRQFTISCGLMAILQNFFYNNSSILLKIEDPTDDERMAFLKPLFFDRNIVSLVTVLENSRTAIKETKKSSKNRKAIKALGHIINKGKRKRSSSRSSFSPVKKRQRRKEIQTNLVRSNSVSSFYDIHKEIKQKKSGVIDLKRSGSMRSIDDTVASYSSTPYFSTVLSNLLNQRGSDQGVMVDTTLKTFLSNKRLNCGAKDDNEYVANNMDDPPMQHIYTLWKHASMVTSNKMYVTQLELLYDVISACINIHWNSFESLVKNLEDILRNIEHSNSIDLI
ncbi:hypothetical protein HUJ04_004957 [Dendroctonus ponderosae]|nr:hypothetical protein HUJ04_004957 [Dendroctonus ponderosae]